MHGPCESNPTQTPLLLEVQQARAQQAKLQRGAEGMSQVDDATIARLGPKIQALIDELKIDDTYWRNLSFDFRRTGDGMSLVASMRLTSLGPPNFNSDPK